MLGCEQVGLELEEATVGQIGLGAAGLGTASLMVEAGVRRVIASDPNEETHATATERGIAIAEMDEVMRDCDLVVASSGVPGLIQPGMVREGQIILALSNPDPEIRPRDALDAGAAFATDGSVVNNALGYPGIFRGALLAGASTINSEMKLAAARRIAELASESELMPNALSREVHAAVTAAVRAAAVASGVGRPEQIAAGGRRGLGVRARAREPASTRLRVLGVHQRPLRGVEPVEVVDDVVGLALERADLRCGGMRTTALAAPSSSVPNSSRKLLASGSRPTRSRLRASVASSVEASWSSYAASRVEPRRVSSLTARICSSQEAKPPLSSAAATLSRWSSWPRGSSAPPSSVRMGRGAMNCLLAAQ
ncbi:MAG: malic enzyme-like NAD(P)-binding protein [Thermoleophilaceae bacterium]